MEKKTKAMYFNELREMVTSYVEESAEREDLLEFIDKQLELIEKRKVAASEKAAKKKSESDALTETIFSLIGEDLITVDEIVEAINDENVTRNKVTARLGKLVKNELIVKVAVKMDGNKRMAYRRPTEE